MKLEPPDDSLNNSRSMESTSELDDLQIEFTDDRIYIGDLCVAMIDDAHVHFLVDVSDYPEMSEAVLDFLLRKQF